MKLVLSLVLLCAVRAATAAESSSPISPAAVFFSPRENRFVGTNFGRWAQYTQQGMRFDSGLTVTFAGSNPSVQLQGSEVIGASIHTILGAAERTSHKAYGAVRYTQLYPGVGLECRFSNHGFKSDFILSPGANVAAIRMHYSGIIGSATIGEQGQLRFVTARGEMQETIPAVYQTDPHGAILFREGRYTIGADGVIGFSIEDLDPTLPAVIDPDLIYSSYWGASRNEAITAVAVGTDDSIFIAGWTESTNLVTAAPYQATNKGSTDGFVAKLSPNGQTLLWATYLGGTGADRITGMVLDSIGRPILVGATYSTDFPKLLPVQSTLRGSVDAFITRLSASGAALDFSTYYGGTATDLANAVAVDAYGIYVGGQTTSADYPVVNALYPTARGGQDGFLIKLALTGTSVTYSTYVGGAFDDAVNAVASLQGDAFVAGGTASANLPVVQGLGPRGGMDAFVMHFNAAGTALIASTYLGGTGGSALQPETATAIKVTAFGEAVVGGITSSSDFVATNGAQTVFGKGGSDGFVVKYNSQLSALQWGTYLGGSSYDAVSGIALRASGQVAVTGATSSFNFPSVLPVQSSLGGFYDSFLTVYHSAGTLMFSSVWGGSGSDASAAIATGIFNPNALLIGGSTTSTNLTMAGGGYQPTADPQSLNGFLARMQVPGGAAKGADKIGIFRQAQAGWALDKSGDFTWGAGDIAFSMGAPGDYPVIGDWDGTGRYRVGIFRAGTWYFDINGDNAWTWGIDTYAYFGVSGDIPVVGDWNGSGKTKIGVYRNGLWVLDWDGNNSWTTGVDRTYVWGAAGDVPVTGDWTGTGITRIGLFNNGLWKLDLNGDFAFTAGVDSQATFGQAGDLPIPCDIFLMGSTQKAVFRPSTGAWITVLGVVGYFGFPGDLPIAAPWL